MKTKRLQHKFWQLLFASLLGLTLLVSAGVEELQMHHPIKAVLLLFITLYFSLTQSLCYSHHREQNADH